MQRILIIGWDGATFDLIRPWVAEGKLPVIARLLASGTHGELASTMPPMTFAAWSSFLTGRNPGQHGIYDFTRLREGSYELEFLSGANRHGTSFWRLLSDAGRRVIAISIPCTFPPEPVRGVMISGFDAPGVGNRDDCVDRRGMFPPEIYDELVANVGRHPIGAFSDRNVIADINRNRPDLALAGIREAIRAKTETAKYLLSHREWDCAMLLYGESDGAAHHFWKYHDPKSPLYSPRWEAYRNSLLAVYQELDRRTGELLAQAGDETTVVMMSDHGFGGVSNWLLYPNRWLAERGLLAFRGVSAQRWSRLVDAAKLKAVLMLPGGIKQLLFRFAGRRLGAIESQVRFGAIDWRQTRAFFDENPYYPALWINLWGRQPQGIVEPGEDYETQRSRLIDELTAWKHPSGGEPIVANAWRREEIYHGPCLDDAPDIVVEWGHKGGYSYAFKLSAKSPDPRWTRDIDPLAPEAMQFFTGKSGHHRSNGIFLAAGRAIRTGETIQGARIVDLAPTILHMLGVPVPGDLDGRALEEIFTDDFVPQPATPQTATPSDDHNSGDGPADADTYSAEDEQVILERLRSLGYIE